MIVFEKKAGEKSWSELLFQINDMNIQPKNEQVLNNQWSVPNSWRGIVENKIIVFFHPDLYIEKRYVNIESRIEQYFSALYSLSVSIRHMKNIVLWWYDEGRLEAWIEAIDDKERHNKLLNDFLWITQCCFSKVIHDTSGNLARAMQWSDLYYGDKSLISKEWIQTGKPIILYAPADVSTELEKWLDISITENDDLSDVSPLEGLLTQQKCVLFYMGKSDLLLYGNKAVALAEQLSYLAKIRDDLFIWWVVDSNLLSSSELLVENLQIDLKKSIQKFKACSNTFFDDSSHLYRALKHADFFYGSPHALKLGSVNIPFLYPKYDKIKKLPTCPQISSIYREKEKIYFIYNERNTLAVLCEANLETDEIIVLCDVPNDVNDNEWGLDYYYLIKANNKIIMVPCFSEKGFYEYDVSEGVARLVPCNQIVWKPNRMHYSAFDSYTVWGGSAFFLSNANGLIVEYNFDQNEYIYHKEWSDIISHQISHQDMIFTTSVRIDNMWYTVVKNTDFMVKIDLSAMSASVIKMHLPTGFQVHRLMKVPESRDLWLSPLKGNILICLHTEKNEMDIIKCDSMPNNQRYPFFSVIRWQDGIAFMPYYASNVYLYRNGEIAYSDPLLTRKMVRPFENNDTRNEVHVTENGELGDSCLLFRERGTELIEVVHQTGDIFYHKFRFKSSDKKKLEKVIRTWNMDNVIQPLMDEIEKGQNKETVNIGRRIWQKVNSMML